MTVSLSPARRSACRTVVACIAILVLAALAQADATGTKVATKPTAIRVPQSPPQGGAASVEQAVFEKVNAIRRERGLAPVRLASDLLTVARNHSEEQARRNWMTHRSADGKSAGERLDAAQVAWLRYGENVGLVKGYSDPAATVVEAWLHSPGHAANILDSQLAESAVGVAQAADGTYFLTQVFVTR